MTKKKTQTSLGLDENLAAALAYILGWLSGLVIVLIEKENKFVRFHAYQSLFTFLPLFLINLFPMIGWMLSPILVPAQLILIIVLVVKAAQGERFKLPIVGDLAEKYA